VVSLIIVGLPVLITQTHSLACIHRLLVSISFLRVYHTAHVPTLCRSRLSQMCFVCRGLLPTSVYHGLRPVAHRFGLDEKLTTLLRSSQHFFSICQRIVVYFSDSHFPPACTYRRPILPNIPVMYPYSYLPYQYLPLDLSSFFPLLICFSGDLWNSKGAQP
jgi:hypothetical protein